MCTVDEWRTAQAAGERVAPSLHTEGFIHCSTPVQVHLPANRLFAGRDDIMLLVIDEQGLDAEVRWEPGVPGDPESMRFPHVYGTIPVAAVQAAYPYRPGPDGTFGRPDLGGAHGD